MSSAVAAPAVAGPPGPPGPRLPAPIQGFRFLLTEHRMLERYRRRYGDVFAVAVWPFTPLVVVSDPAEVRRIFTGDPAQLHAGEGNTVLGPLVGAHSVLLLDEAEHLRRRKVLLPAFHGERMRVYGEEMRELAEAEVATWPVGVAFALLPALQRITLRVILRTVFGMRDGGALEARLIRLLAQSQAMMLPAVQRDLGRLSPWGRFLRTRASVDELIYAEIARRRREGDQGGEDVLSLLLETDATDVELRDDLMTLLVAGHETTATTMAWTLERLVRHPALLARARDDADYLDAAVKEAQRMRPVVTYAMRKLVAPMEVGGYAVPAGATLGTSITLMHRRADLYPEPYAFRPERFLDARPETYAWIPFGGGVRRCLGAAFATYEMRAVLSTILARRDLRAPDPRPEPWRRKMITFVPARGARVTAEARA